VNQLRERWAKARALALLGSMGAVALGLWQWPAPRGAARPVVRPDVVLPADPAAEPEPIAVAAAPPPAPVDEPRAAVVRIAPASATGPLDAAEVEPSLDLPVRARATALPAGEHVALAALPARPAPLQGRPYAAVVTSPVTPAPTLERAAEGNAFARAGLAIGRAFRRAGVNTASAFTRIF
jgi:hypothetical protein